MADGRLPPTATGAWLAKDSVVGGRRLGWAPESSLRCSTGRLMTCRLAEPARTGCCCEGGLVLVPIQGPGLRCRLLRRGRGTGQFLAADPDGGDRDEQGEQPDRRGNLERTGKPGRQSVMVDGRRPG
jgi:hypothetical protein